MTQTKTLIKLIFLIPLLGVFVQTLIAGDTADSLKNNWLTIHFQTTVLSQSHPAIKAPYSGDNSLSTAAESNTSVSSTLFIGAKLWKGAEVYFNPEMSGGSGFSATKGIAAFTNGEVYRVDSPSPKIFPARYYLKQVFSFSKEMVSREDAVNQVQANYPVSYLALYAGKFSMLDFFDANQYSHDPRTQFYNWALMGNGAWDYPADTRGYTNGVVAEYVNPVWALRGAAVMVASQRNGATFDTQIFKSNSMALEFEKPYSLLGGIGKIRLLAYLTRAQMGNYALAVSWANANHTVPNLDVYPAYGRTKYGFGLNVEHTFSENLGTFMRAGWNDGHNESWAFTEIDQHVSAGFVFTGTSWNRKDDKLGIAQVVDGLSSDHRNYLAAGGYGFIIGDGRLNYAPECITELYYSFKMPGVAIWLAPDYQLVVNPGYNKDRGPVHAFGIRFHAEL